MHAKTVVAKTSDAICLGAATETGMECRHKSRVGLSLKHAGQDFGSNA